MVELERLGLVARNPLARRYHVGPRLEELAVNAIRQGMAQSSRRLHMQRVAERSGKRVNVGIVAGEQLVHVLWVDSAGPPLKIDVQPGARIPMHCSESGKLLVALGDVALRERFLASAPFTAHTANTITTAADLRREMERIRRQGYSEDNEEFLAGVCCIAVPVRGRRDGVVAGLAIMAPSARPPLTKAREYLPNLFACADAISADLGRRSRPSHPGPSHRRNER